MTWPRPTTATTSKRPPTTAGADGRRVHGVIDHQWHYRHHRRVVRVWLEKQQIVAFTSELTLELQSAVLHYFILLLSSSNILYNEKMSRPWSKSVDAIIQFDQLLDEAFIWSDGPFAPKKQKIKKNSHIICISRSSWNISYWSKLAWQLPSLAG